MYGGAILYFIGAPLLLGSWYALAIGILMIGILALRAVWEEQMLIAELPGYADYAQRALPDGAGSVVTGDKALILTKIRIAF